MTCLCGQELAPVLARLGSPWCHECREDEERLSRVVLGQRESVETPRENRAAPAAQVVSLRSRAARRRSDPWEHGPGPALAA
jgi:hypothetical protein